MSAILEQHAVTIPIQEIALEGDLTVPADVHGVVLFAHGSGSSRFSRRNRYVAGELNRIGLATLLIDLLTREEEAVDDITANLRFDIGMLADRLVATIDWMKAEEPTARQPVGVFGASTGGGAALVAAAQRKDRVNAVVSRGGRPDLAGSALPDVAAPTLLIVGGEDEIVIDLNQQAMRQMTANDVELRIIPGATHLFEEPGALEQVARLAGEWFGRYLT